MPKQYPAFDPRQKPRRKPSRVLWVSLTLNVCAAAVFALMFFNVLQLNGKAHAETAATEQPQQVASVEKEDLYIADLPLSPENQRNENILKAYNVRR